MQIANPVHAHSPALQTDTHQPSRQAKIGYIPSSVKAPPSTDPRPPQADSKSRVPPGGPAGHSSDSFPGSHTRTRSCARRGPSPRNRTRAPSSAAAASPPASWRVCPSSPTPSRPAARGARAGAAPAPPARAPAGRTVRGWPAMRGRSS